MKQVLVAVLALTFSLMSFAQDEELKFQVQGVQNRKTKDLISVICNQKGLKENECQFVKFSQRGLNDELTVLANGKIFSPQQIDRLMDTVLKEKILNPKTEFYRGTNAVFNGLGDALNDYDGPGPAAIVITPIWAGVGVAVGAVESTYYLLRLPFAAVRNHNRANKFGEVVLKMNNKRFNEFLNLVNGL